MASLAITKTALEEIGGQKENMSTETVDVAERLKSQQRQTRTAGR